MLFYWPPVSNTEGKSLELHSPPSASKDADGKDGKDKEKEVKGIKMEVKKEKEGEGSDGSSSQLSPAELEQLANLKDVSCRVRSLPPCLPSVCFYTFINAHQG